MTTQPTNGDQGDTVHIVPPPVLYLIALLVALVPRHLWPLRPLPRGLARLVGWLLVGSGLALGAWGVLTFRNSGESPNPAQPTETLVTGGPFRYSRNPLYVGMTACYLGVTALLDSIWPLVLLPLVLRLIDKRVIPTEEAYLARRFGDAYEDYRRRVRRWL